MTTIETNGSSGDGGALCGDGVIEGSEQCDCGGGPCDAAGLGDMTCADVDDPAGPFRGGALGCNPGSCEFDTSQCV